MTALLVVEEYPSLLFFFRLSIFNFDSASSYGFEIAQISFSAIYRLIKRCDYPPILCVRLTSFHGLVEAQA